MKIALFTDGIHPYVVGGMQKHSYYLAKYLAKNDIYIDLYHCIPYGQTLVKDLEGFTKKELSFIRQFCFNFPKASRYPGHYIVRSYVYSKILYDAFMENGKVDFVYAQGFSGWYYMKKKKSGITLPLIGVNFHGLEMFQKAASFRSKLEQIMFKAPVRRVLCQSDYVFSLGGKLTAILKNIVKDSKKVVTISIGIGENWLIDDKISYCKTNHIRQFVFIGRYERRKGIEELSEVLSTMKKAYNFKFHFIGPIPEENKISSDKVIYHGLVREEEKIKSILRGADVLVSPSYSEGMPTVILEAMVSGCAVIASDVGAVCDEVDKANGWLILPGDKKTLEKTLIEAIEISDEQLLSKKEASMKRIKEKFLWNDVAKKTILFIESVIERKGI